MPDKFLTIFPLYSLKYLNKVAYNKKSGSFKYNTTVENICPYGLFSVIENKNINQNFILSNRFIHYSFISNKKKYYKLFTDISLLENITCITSLYHYYFQTHIREQT